MKKGMTPGQEAILSHLCNRAECEDLKRLRLQVIEQQALIVLTRDAIIAKCGKKAAAKVANLVMVGIQKGLVDAIAQQTVEDLVNEKAAKKGKKVVLTDALGKEKG